MAVAAPAAALLTPSSSLLADPRPKLIPDKLRLARLRPPTVLPSAAFPPNSSFAVPSLALTRRPRLNPKRTPPRSARLRVSCFLSSAISSLPSGTPLATDPSTTGTVAAAVTGFIHEKLAPLVAPLLSRTPTAEEISRLASFSLAAIQQLLGITSTGSAVEFRAPLLALAAVASKWVGLYSEVLMVVCLLSWFPNMPWDRQPFSAMRDLTDPFMRMFRGIIPPVFGSMDVSTLIGFALLGVVRSMLNVGGVDGLGEMWAA